MNNIKKIEFVGITKVFNEIKANNEISFSVFENEIHALLGENGAGKSTLMSILFGLYKPESGYIKLNGNKCTINNPREANKLKIAMLPQHFNLISNLTVWENIVLGYEINKYSLLDKKAIFEKIKNIQQKYKIELDITAKISDISISDCQKVEIIKILWNDADILIFDEPTSILTPNQIISFLQMLRDLKSYKKTILLITHKLNEIAEIADRCTIIRKGKYISTIDAKSTPIDKLAEMMIGEKVSLNLTTIPKNGSVSKNDVLKITNLCYSPLISGGKTLEKINLEVKANEILGIASIEGNGSSELFKIISGDLKANSGNIHVDNWDITKTKTKSRYFYFDETKSIRKNPILNCWYLFLNSITRPFRKIDNALRLISYIPEDRHAEGLILDYSVSQNAVLQDIKKYTKYGVIQGKQINEFARNIVSQFDVRGVNNSAPHLTKVYALSGGNQQKLIVGREVARKSRVLLAFNPTRGLDVGAINHIYTNMINYRNSGGSVLLYSGELDEVIEVSDRIAILYKGSIVKIVKPTELSKLEIGIYMAQGFLDKSNEQGAKHA